MTLAEAQQIAEIIAGAAQGYPPVVDDLVAKFNAAFPQFSWRTTYQQTFGPDFAAQPVQVAEVML